MSSSKNTFGLGKSPHQPAMAGKPPADERQATGDAPANRARSAREKALVWGGIAVLAVVVNFQAGAYFSHWAAKRPVEAKMIEAGPEHPINIDEVQHLIKRKPTITKERRGILEVDLYSWKWSGVFRSYSIELAVDAEREITGYEF